jgi:hypothetical protein
MTMKQTQTKMFDFADVGLDFCAGSKSLFPDRFKKMLAQGYNTQTVSSVTIAGNQVTLNYGMSHGYVADRVLKLNTTALADINNGEFVIDSVTTQTVTLTIDNAPQSLAGNFTTYIAPLGYELVYEQANIHIYKFKALDESDLFLRLCFQAAAGYRNRIAPCVGKTADLVTGVIMDENALTETKNIANPAIFSWEFSYMATSLFNNYTAAQGSGFGRGYLIGSLYHLVILTNTDNQTYNLCGAVNALLPTVCLDYEILKTPILMGASFDSRTSDGRVRAIDTSYIYAGGIPLRIQASSVTIDSIAPQTPFAQSSYLPNAVDIFNTTTCYPIPLYHRGTGQFFGYAQGLYIAAYGGSNTPPTNRKDIPMLTQDIDFESKVAVHQIDWNSPNGGVWFAAPIEEVKIA